MTRRSESIDVPYAAEQMFDLVADVERYPEFIPYCVGLRKVRDGSEDGVGEMTADMLVAFGVFREKFRSRVRLDRPSGVIDVEYVEGPFRRLTNRWRFENRQGGGSRVDFDIEFEFRSRLLEAAARRFLEKVVVKMADAFVSRAHVLFAEEPVAGP